MEEDYGVFRRRGYLLRWLGIICRVFLWVLGVIFGVRWRRMWGIYADFMLGCIFGVVTYHWSYQIYRIIMEKYLLPKIY